MWSYDDAADLRHLPGLPEVAVVETPVFRKTLHVAATAVRDGEMAAFTGAAGLGKTFAVDVATRASGLECVWVQVGPKPSPKEVTARILKELNGVFPSGTLYELSDDAVDQLSDARPLVVLDEAQNFDKAGLDQIRYLHDRSGNGFPLFLVGGASCAEVLRSDPQLADRVGGWVHFEPLTGPHLFSTLTAYHPFFANSEPTLLADVDRRYAKGRFRRWARFLKTALPLAARADTPDHLIERVARAALATLDDGRKQ